MKTVGLAFAAALVFAPPTAHADSSPTCMTINQFIAGLEAGRPPVVVKLGPSTPSLYPKARRYMFAPEAPRNAKAAMEIEVVDGEFWEKLGAKKIRVRPHGVSHFIDVAPTAVSFDRGDVINACTKDTNQACILRSWTFEGEGSALGVGLFVSAQGKDEPPGSGFLDEVFLNAQANACNDLQREFRFMPENEVPKFGGSER